MPSRTVPTAVISSHAFFFFQAEDGIRDFHVTGVQTCALPILDKCGAYATTKSWRLAGQIQMLLSRLGVISFVGTTWSRATTGRMTEKQKYARIAVYGDDVVALSEHV